MGLAGRVMRLRDAGGLGCLAALLARPDIEVHVLDLVGGARAAAGLQGREGLAAGLHVTAGDAGPGIDGQAREAYRVRLTELRAELDEAEANHDPARADAARHELEALTRALTR